MQDRTGLTVFLVRVVFVLFETRRFCKVARFVFPDLGYACGTLHVLSYLFSIEVLASFVPEAEVGMVAGIRGSCPDGSRLVSSDDVGHPLFDGGKS